MGECLKAAASWDERGNRSLGTPSKAGRRREVQRTSGDGLPRPAVGEWSSPWALGKGGRVWRVFRRRGGVLNIKGRRVTEKFHGPAQRLVGSGTGVSSPFLGGRGCSEHSGGIYFSAEGRMSGCRGRVPAYDLDVGKVKKNSETGNLKVS